MSYVSLNITGCFQFTVQKRLQNERQKCDSKVTAVSSDLTVASLDPDMMTFSSY